MCDGCGMHDKKPVIIAVCGKGGVGKTSVSAAIVKLLMENPNNRVLAIDADPAVGLASALGIEPARTVDDVRIDLAAQLVNGSSGSKKEILAKLDYQLLEAIKEMDNLAFLAIGRPEQTGCYCAINNLLKDIIGSVADQFDFVIIDGEAGIEQVNRRVMERVTHLLQVSDASARGINVAKNILELAGKVIQYDKTGLILNRIRGEDEMAKVVIPLGLNCLGWLPEDDDLREADMQGKCVLDLSDSAFLFSLRNCLAKVGVDANGEEHCHA